MKKFLFLQLFWCVTVATNAGGKIKGEVKNAQDNQSIYLYQHYVGQLSPIDSCPIKSGKFSFKFSSAPGQYKLGLNSTQAADLVLGDESISITADANSFTTSFSWTESPENDLFKTYVATMTGFDTHTNEINMRARKIAGADPERDAKILALQTEFNEAKKKRDSELAQLQKNNPTTYAGRCANYVLTSETVEEAVFFKGFNDPSLQTGTVLVQSFNVYFNRFLVGKEQEAIKAELLALPTKLEAGSKGREALYLGLIEWLKGMDPRFAASVAKGYYQEYPSSPFIPALQSTLPVLPPEIGDLAPEIVMNNPDNEEIRLSSTRGQLVLLDFWASWCGPCRKENPNVVKTYEKYKDKGFTVFSVSLDKQLGRWKGAIESDGLIWSTHVSDLKGWSNEAAKVYGVGSIPSTFLLDQNGFIIAKNLRGHQLEQRIQQILGD